MLFGRIPRAPICLVGIQFLDVLGDHHSGLTKTGVVFTLSCSALMKRNSFSNGTTSLVNEGKGTKKSSPVQGSKLFLTALRCLSKVVEMGMFRGKE